MPEIIVKLSRNKLSLMIVESKSEPLLLEQTLSQEIADNRRINDVRLFSGKLSELVKINVAKSVLTFLIEPEDVILRFAIVTKKSPDVLDNIKKQISDIDFGELYFSYQKVAPFVYQFIGIKKPVLETYFEVGNFLKAGIKAIVPWVLLLPKYAKCGSQNAFFSVNDSGRKVVALSELNGIYYVQTPGSKDYEELEKIAKDEALYKSKQSARSAYTFDAEAFSLDPEFNSSKLSVKAEPEFMSHTIYNAVFSENPELLNSQYNLLNLVPVPEKSGKVFSAVVVGIMSLVLLLGAFFYLNSKPASSTKEIAVKDVKQSQAVLSEDDVKETSEATQPKKNEKVIQRSDLKIRIENGAGVQFAAKKAQDYLNALGYKVLEIDNSDESNRDNTLLKFKTGKLEYKDLLVSDVREKYSVVVEESLPDDYEYDVLIVIGLR